MKYLYKNIKKFKQKRQKTILFHLLIYNPFKINYVFTFSYENTLRNHNTTHNLHEKKIHKSQNK